MKWVFVPPSSNSIGVRKVFTVRNTNEMLGAKIRKCEEALTAHNKTAM